MSFMPVMQSAIPNKQLFLDFHSKLNKRRWKTSAPLTKLSRHQVVIRSRHINHRMYQCLVCVVLEELTALDRAAAMLQDEVGYRTAKRHLLTICRTDRVFKIHKKKYTYVPVYWALRFIGGSRTPETDQTILFGRGRLVRGARGR